MSATDYLPPGGFDYTERATKADPIPPQAYAVMRGSAVLYLTNRSAPAFKWKGVLGGAGLQVVKNPQGWKRLWDQMGERAE